MTVAMILGSLGVRDEEIISDYVMSDQHMPALEARFAADPTMVRRSGSLPPYGGRAESRSITRVFAFVREHYGSMREYVQAHGADRRLLERLESLLLQ